MVSLKGKKEVVMESGHVEGSGMLAMLFPNLDCTYTDNYFIMIY